MYRWFRQRALQWQILLALIEFLLLAGCVYVAVALRYWGHADARFAYIDELGARPVLVAAVLILAMTALGQYQIHLQGNWLGRLSRQVVAFALGWIALTVLYYVIPATYVGRGVLGITFAIGFATVVLWRMAFLVFVDADRFKRRVVILGAGHRAAEIRRKMRRKADHRGFKLLGYVPIGTDPVIVPTRLLLYPGEPLHEWARCQGVYEIVVGPDDRRGTLSCDALLECRRRGIRVTELAAFFEREAGTITMGLTNASWLAFSEGFNVSRLQRLLKRGFDLAFATALLLVAWPFMLATALAIWIESGVGSPVLYRQARVGENGRVFNLVKFRSMRIDAESDGVARWASRNDDRVTRVGRFIRKTRLDELPQLWNVLCGDMSIIGPRPERPQFVDEFNSRIRYYSLRHCMKPGLTGWAQLRYPYGASFEDAEEKLKFDLFYVKNQNLVFDLAILVQTVEVVLFGRGAR